MTKKKVVVIGGGTGTFAVLSGLKRYAEQINITAILAMTDSGSSTGRLRDELGALPVGDLRMALVALADESRIDNHTLRELFLYRFQKGKEGLAGHNFGNLLLIALSEVTGSQLSAIEVASRFLHTQGTVLPVSLDSLTLVARYADGSEVVGEKDIDVPKEGWVPSPLTELSVRPKGVVAPGVHDALAQADLIVLGPGDLYTSLLAAVLVGDMSACIARARGKFIYISNLMSKFGQTTDYPLSQYLSEIGRYVGRMPDRAVVNTAELPEELIAKYATIGDRPVDIDRDEVQVPLIEGDFLIAEEVTLASGDTYKRSLIRHDKDKLARALMAYLHTL